MDDNEAFYGSNLAAAKEDFANTYNEELLPAVRRAYATLITEGETRGINWSDVSVVSVNIPGDASMKITFSHGGKTFDLLVERSLVIEGKWKVSQYVRFV
jgi:hypothetical protein